MTSSSSSLSTALTALYAQRRGLDVTGQNIRPLDIQSSVASDVDACREAQAGVNIDEEMVNLLSHQRVDRPVFGAVAPGDRDLFTVLADISAHLKSGDNALLSADLTALNAATNQVIGKLAEVGGNYNRVEQMQSDASDRVITLKSSLSEIENIDLPKTIVELQMQQVAFEAALGATSKIITTSLADFLR